MKYLEERLYDSNNDIKKALEKLKDKINEVIKKVSNIQKAEIRSFLEEIEKLLKYTINQNYKKELFWGLWNGY